MKWTSCAHVAPLLFSLSLTPLLFSGPQDTPAKSDRKAETKVVDPVCGMAIEPKDAEKSVYKGKTYYFCARSEKEAFDKTPEKYIAQAQKKK